MLRDAAGQDCAVGAEVTASVRIWLKGLSGAGKSTVATTLERRFRALGRHSYLLDGDVARGGLCKDLVFTDDDRAENGRRFMEVARLMIGR